MAALVALSGCGQASPSTQRSTQQSGTGASVGACRTGDAQVTDAKQVAMVDLDGDGTADEIRRTSADGQGCPSYLVTTLGGTTSGVPLGATAGATSYKAVTLPGHDGQLLVVRASQPRGGYQIRVFLAVDGVLRELTDDHGKPPFGFVATDVSVASQAVRCGADGTLVLLSAARHRPPGVIAAWDVYSTTLTIDGATATAGPQRKIADNVLDRQLPQRYPDVARNQSFVTGCG